MRTVEKKQARSMETRVMQNCQEFGLSFRSTKLIVHLEEEEEEEEKSGAFSPPVS